MAVKAQVADEVEPPRSDHDRAATSFGGRHRDPLVMGLFVLALVFAAAIRVWLLFENSGDVDSQEAIGGLMGRHVLDGEFHTFYWGQNYGGTFQTLLVAGVFAIFGSSVVTLRFMTIAMTFGSAFLVWRIALRALSRRQAFIAVATFLLWPPLFVWLGNRELLFYVPTVFYGLVILLCTQRVVENPRRTLEWPVIGLLSGLGWWTSPNIMYFVIPAAGYLLLNIRGRSEILRRAPLAIPGAVLGALPWLLAFRRDGFGVFDLPEGAKQGGYLDHLHLYVTDMLRRGLGVVSFTENWRLDEPAAVVVYAVVTSLLVLASWRSIRARSFDGLGFLLYPFIYALTPLSGPGRERYLFFLMGFVPFLVARLSVRRLAVPVLGLIVLVAPIVNIRQLDGDYPGMDRLVRVLDDSGHDQVFAGFWISYRLTFKTSERIMASPQPPWGYRPLLDTVRRSPLPVYVFAKDSKQAALFVEEAGSLGVELRPFDAGSWTVYVPDRKVLPEEFSDPLLVGF